VKKVCVCERERESVCICKWVRVRQREREKWHLSIENICMNPSKIQVSNPSCMAGSPNLQITSPSSFAFAFSAIPIDIKGTHECMFIHAWHYRAITMKKSEKNRRKKISSSQSYKTFFSSFSNFRCLVWVFCNIEKKSLIVKWPCLATKNGEILRYRSKKKSFIGSASGFILI